MNTHSHPLSLLQIQPDWPKLVRFLQAQGLNDRADEDWGYGLHAWLAALFGEFTPKPFRLFLDPRNRKPPKLLAYTTYTKESLLEHAQTFPEPIAREVCDLQQGIASAVLPGSWRSGRRLGFEVMTCPIVRNGDKERDVFLAAADRAGKEGGLRRERVYSEWLIEQLAPTCVVETVEMVGFRLIRQLRRNQASSGNSERKATAKIRPQALLRGIMTVRDGEAFGKLLASGIGRHRAFGYGMLLLRPVP